MKLEKRASSVSARQQQPQTQTQNQTTNTTVNNMAESMAEITIAASKSTSSLGSGSGSGTGANLSVPPVLEVPFSPTDVGKWAKDRVLSHEEFICELEA